VRPYARNLISLASRNNLAHSSQGCPARPWGVSQPASLSSVCEGANKVTARRGNTDRRYSVIWRKGPVLGAKLVS